MKKAFVHCRIMDWWALEVLMDLIRDQDPKKTKIFTIFSDRKFLEVDNKKFDIITALPNKINQIFLRYAKHKTKILSNIFDYRNLMFFYIPLMKILSKKIDKFNPSKIIISSFAVAKNLEIAKSGNNETKIKTILYLHSPMQYIRANNKDYQQKITGYKWILFNLITKKLQKRDKKYTKYDQVFFNSEYTKSLAKEIYSIEWKVSYPIIKSEYLTQKISNQTDPYYIYIGRVAKLIRETDTVIQLFNKTKQSLIIIGDGPDYQEMKEIAWDNIIFVGRLNDTQEIIKIIKKSKGLINLSKESLGIATIQCLLLWIPVFGFNGWWTAELVDKKSGVLVKDKDKSTLIQQWKNFETTKRNKEIISQNIKDKLKQKPFVQIDR